MGKGKGQGTGTGEGQGQASERNRAVGCGVISVAVLVFIVCELPLIIMGSFLMAMTITSADWGFYLGLGFIIVASVLFFGGIIFGILVCCGACGNGNPRNNASQGTGVTFTSPAPGEASYPMQQYPPQHSQVGSSGDQRLYPTQPQAVQYYSPTGAYPS